MFVLLFLVLEIGLHRCSENDTPFVINRASNRVEFSDLLLEYNHNHADNSFVEVTISFSVQYLYTSSQTVSLFCDIFQFWRDSRLKHAGTNSTNIPKDIKIWVPDTSFVNAAATFGSESSLRLYSDGIVCRKQRAFLSVPCIPHLNSSFDVQNGLKWLNCSLIIESFDNRGAQMIRYRVGNLTQSGVNWPMISRIANYTSSNFDEKTLNGELLHQTIVHFFIVTVENAQLSNTTELW